MTNSFTRWLQRRQLLGYFLLAFGITWAFWHLLVDFRYNFSAMGARWLLDFAVVFLATLTPYRMLIHVGLRPSALALTLWIAVAAVLRRSGAR